MLLGRSVAFMWSYLCVLALVLVVLTAILYIVSSLYLRAEVNQVMHLTLTMSLLTQEKFTEQALARAILLELQVRVSCVYLVFFFYDCFNLLILPIFIVVTVNQFKMLNDAS